MVLLMLGFGGVTGKAGGAKPPLVDRCILMAGVSSVNCTVTAQDGTQLRVKKYRLAGTGGTLLFIAGGPGVAGSALFGDDPTEALRPEVNDTFSELIVVDPRGVGLDVSRACRFEFSQSRPFLVTQYVGSCVDDQQSAAKFHSAQLADDISVVASALRLRSVTVMAQSWGVVVGLHILHARPGWLKSAVFDSPAWVLSSRTAVAESVAVVRERVVDSGLETVLTNPLGLSTVWDRARYEVLVISSLENLVLQGQLRSAVDAGNLDYLRKLFSRIEVAVPPDSSYVAYVCANAVPQVVSGKELLGSYEQLRAEFRLCDRLPVPRRPLPAVRRTRIPLSVLCSTNDFRAPLSGCRRIAKQLGATLTITPGTVHGLTTITSP